MIVDAHAHVSDTEYGNAQLLIRRMDEAGVDRAIVVPGGTVDVRQMSQFVSGELKAPARPIPNHLVYQAIADYPQRLVGFCSFNPLERDEAYQIFETALARGCTGVKLNPIAFRFAFAGEVLDDIAELCGKRGIPIYSHVVFDPGANTLKYGSFARRHPRTNFILGHMGFGSCDGNAFKLAAELPNFYLETSLANHMSISEALRIAGDDKLVFGSEFPMSYAKIQLFQIREFPVASQVKILSENIRRIVPALA